MNLRKNSISPTDYSILLNRVSIYSNAETNIERTKIRQAFGKHFQMPHSNLSSPILALQNLESLKSSTQTQLIIIDKNHQETFKRDFHTIIKNIIY